MYMKEGLVTFGCAAEAEYTEKKSIFIGQAAPVESVPAAEAFLLSVRERHMGARHHVFAYIIGSAVRCSDDGEPKGTGGVPVLEVLKKSGADQALIVVTRYFGGILLGAPGLVRAYSKAASMAVSAAGLVIYKSYTECRLIIDYSVYDRMMYEIGKRDILVDGTDFAGEITLRLAVLTSDYEAFCKMVFSLTGGKRLPEKVAVRLDGKTPADR